jgi:ElaB/YqjD/DUF883 family membrane-anchored ribosome-binding protein
MPQQRRNKEEEEEKSRFNWAKEKISDAKNRTKEFVEENPWKTAAISAAVGAGVAILVSAIIGRRREETFLDRLRNIF